MLHYILLTCNSTVPLKNALHVRLTALESVQVAYKYAWIDSLRILRVGLVSHFTAHSRKWKLKEENSFLGSVDERETAFCWLLLFPKYTSLPFFCFFSRLYFLLIKLKIKICIVCWMVCIILNKLSEHTYFSASLLLLLR